MASNSRNYLQLQAFSDADWGGNIDDCTSTYAYIIYLGGNLVSWLSKWQRAVVRSYTEAGYRLVANILDGVMWFVNLLSELDVKKVASLL